jgi:GTPase SAR1 family protein
MELKKFDMNKIKFSDSPIIIMIGRRSTGKTYLINDILKHQDTIPTGHIISHFRNEISNEHITDLNDHPEYDQYIKKYTNEYIDELITKTDTVIIFDDTIINHSYDKLKRIFMNGRQNKISLILGTQYPYFMSPLLRSNIDYVFIFKDSFEHTRKRIYTHYVTIFPTYESFCQVLDSCSGDYECLVIDNTINSHLLEDRIFWYKA